jgi:hypothetical protein
LTSHQIQKSIRYWRSNSGTCTYLSICNAVMRFGWNKLDWRITQFHGETTEFAFTKAFKVQQSTSPSIHFLIFSSFQLHLQKKIS